MCMRNIGIEIEPAVVKKNLRYAYGPDAGGCGLSISVGMGVSFERDRGLGVAERNIRRESGVGRICVLTYVVQNRTYARIYLDI